jgi:hypothetical protein
MISSVVFTDPSSAISEAEDRSFAWRLDNQASGSRLGKFLGRDWGISWPPVGRFVTAYGEDPTAADNWLNHSMS